MKTTSIRIVILAVLVSILSACGTMGAGVNIPMNDDGKRIELSASLYTPEGKKGPFPVVIFSHGSWYPDSRMIAFNYHNIFSFFEERGYAVLYVYRRGYGSSGGKNNEPLCKGSTNESGLRAAGADVQAALEYVKRNPSLDSSRIILAGHSRGGLLSTVVAAFIPDDGIKGVVNFSGNWTTCFRQFNYNALKFTSTGLKKKVKNLWLYAEGDSFVNETQARGYAETFIQAGGNLEFKIYPLGAGGHDLYDHPSYWKKDVQSFLEKVMK